MIRVLIAILIALPLLAQEEPAPLRPLPVGDVLLSLPSNQVVPHGQWEIKFSHRFNQSLDEGSFSDQLHSLFGLDTNADVVFGAAYAMRPNLQLSLMRSNVNDTLEGAAKYVVLRQTGGAPLTVTARGGFDIRTEKDLEDRTSFFAQAIVSRQFGRKAEVFLLPTVATNAGRAVSGDGSVALFDYAFNAPVGVVWMLRPGLAAVVELTPPNTDLPTKWTATSAGPSASNATSAATGSSAADEQPDHARGPVRDDDVPGLALGRREPAPRLQHRAQVRPRK
jgi:hypothetical protein